MINALSAEDIRNFSTIGAFLLNLAGIMVISWKLSASVGAQLQTLKYHGDILKTHGELIEDVSSRLANICSTKYLLEHKEARELLHTHTVDCRSLKK